MAVSFVQPREARLTSSRNWWSGEPKRVGSSSCARREASPSKYAPSSTRIRPMALSRLLSSKSSDTKCVELAAVPEELLERARQPAILVGEVRAQDLVELLGGASLAVVLRSTSASNSRRTKSTSSVVPASWSACRPMRSARRRAPAGPTRRAGQRRPPTRGPRCAGGRRRWCRRRREPTVATAKGRDRESDELGGFHGCRLSARRAT